MWSKKLEKRIAKHKVFSKEIQNYANSVLGVDLRLKSVNNIAIELEKMRQTAINEQKTMEQKYSVSNNQDINKKAILSFIQKIEEMIEKYRKMDNEIKKLKKIETMGKDTSIISDLPKNLIVDQLTQRIIEGFKRYGKKIHTRKRPVLYKLPNGKFRCDSLEQFVIGYCTLLEEFPDAPPLEPDIIRDYLVSKRYLKPYSDEAIESAINQYKF
jgi:hypothetical protein